MYSFLEYCRLLIITLFSETQFHVILVIAPYAKPKNCQNDDFSPADFCWESTWFLVMRDLAFESSVITRQLSGYCVYLCDPKFSSLVS